MSESTSARATSPPGHDRIVRHALVDRLLHWLIAASILALLATAFLPILGVEFGWVPIHWAAGFALIALVLIHIVRALFWQSLGDVWIGYADLREAAGIVRRTLRLSSTAPIRPGKYSFAQKLIHLAFSGVVLAACVTGALMMVRIDTPWWDRNPYWLSDGSWGVIYVVHGMAALLLITMVMCHAYFAIRPEKRLFLRSMISGWITRAEYRRYHDPARWRVPE
jgi:cytochrome b subunit of formate dehydrogenase